MTIVCAYKSATSDQVYMAADSKVVAGHFVFPESERKIFGVRDRWLIGMSGPSRGKDALRDMAFGKDPREISAHLYEWHVKNGGEPLKEDGSFKAYGFSALAAREGGLWGICGDGSVWQPDPEVGFAAIGSGQDFAYGCFWGLRAEFAEGRLSPVSLVRRCVAAACQFRADCGGLVSVESVGD